MNNGREQKSSFPFRLGCTSWVYPDSIVPNVRKMATIVDDIELVIFESVDFGNIPDVAAINELRIIADNNNLTYSIHLPTNFKAGSLEKKERLAFAEQCLRVIDLFWNIPLSNFVMHLEGLSLSQHGSNNQQWLDSVNDTCTLIKDGVKDKSNLILVENLGKEVNDNLKIAGNYGFGICLDVGHLLVSASEWKEIFSTNISSASVIHFHGIENNKDHKSLACGPHKYVSDVIQIINDSGYSGVITLEVFGIEDTFGSLKVFNSIWAK